MVLSEAGNNGPPSLVQESLIIAATIAATVAGAAAAAAKANAVLPLQ